MLEFKRLPTFVKGSRNKQHKKMMKDILAIDFCKEDRIEVMAVFDDDKTFDEAIYEATEISTEVYVAYVDDKASAIFGYAKLKPGAILPWLLTDGTMLTHNSKYIKEVMKHARTYISKLKGFGFPLANFVWSKHTVSLNFLTHLGFIIDETGIKLKDKIFYRFYMY